MGRQFDRQIDRPHVQDVTSEELDEYESMVKRIVQRKCKKFRESQASTEDDDQECFVLRRIKTSMSTRYNISKKDLNDWNLFWEFMWKAGCHSIGPNATLLYQNPQQKALDDQAISIFQEYRFVVVDEPSAKVAWDAIKQKNQKDQKYQCILL